MFTRAYPNGKPVPSEGYWFAVNNRGILISRAENERRVPSGKLPLSNIRPQRVLHLGDLDGVACLACDVDDELALPEGFRVFNLRDLFGHIHDEHYAIAGYASQIVLWQRNGKFCSRCGSPLSQIDNEWGKRCERCGFTMYPPVMPCTITLVHDGDRILLSHKAGWGPRYGLVAGFVEPGESLEDSLRREVKEEVGVDVGEIRYFRSQPWPFPHQLMCGFFAQYVGGEIAIDTNELDDAKWFHRNDLPVIPPPLSIARQLIDKWMSEEG
jgi:NAD+ diphosphatase